MPALMHVFLDSPRVVVHPKWLHGAACELFEGSEADHHAQDKPFSVGPVRGISGGALWRLGWLADSPLPDLAGVVRFGSVFHEVREHQVEEISFAALAAGRPVCSAGLAMVSPMYFSRNGRDHPIPDPVLIVRSLARRWNVAVPATVAIPDELRDRLCATVLLADMQGGTVAAPVTTSRDQVGFVGTVRLELPRHAELDIGVVFAALMRFAELAGIGAQTTHGFGAVDLLGLEELGAPRAGHRTGQRAPRGVSPRAAIDAAHRPVRDRTGADQDRVDGAGQPVLAEATVDAAQRPSVAGSVAKSSPINRA